ncbi:MAG TPA: FAD-dependent oxidoreductase [Gaiellaceae bacterium]|jgi:glycine/D-amino acid oxidase-like deaminating enzyme|nr:FAD-dependent oxidoreductase [Gaiellaceae bacterium]
MASLWLEEPFLPRPASRLEGPAEVEIVGGGVTGCSCALTLARAGLRVRLHEAREIASGASGRNGGFALRGGAMPYHQACEALGPGDAALLWRLTETGLGTLAALAGDAFRFTGSVRLAADAAELEAVRDEHEALAKDGFAVEWIEPLPAQLRRFAGGFRHAPDGAIHPARWVRRLASQAAAAGAELREQSRVGSLDELEAPVVVVATDGYTRGLLPEVDAHVHPIRNQVVATEPLDELLFPFPHYARHGYDYWHQLPDGRLVAGGRRDASPAAEETAEEAVTPAIQARLEELVQELLGRLPRLTHRWSGIFGSSPDGLPLAGRMPQRDGVWVALGYAGHGNVLGLVCGDLVARSILGDQVHELRLFDPARLL